MKTALIYYSLSGNCAYVAAHLQERLKTDCFEIKLANDKKRKGFFAILWGVAMVLSKKLPALKPVNFDPSSYDLIILGAPVWASSLAPPMNSFLSKNKISGKKVVLYVCYGGDAGNSVEQFRSLLAGNEIVSETGFKDPSEGKYEELKQQIDEWVKTFTI